MYGDDKMHGAFPLISYTFMACSSAWRELDDSTTISHLRTVIILPRGLTYADSTFCPWSIRFPMAHKKTVTDFPKEGYAVCFWIGDASCVSVGWELNF
jgi:hypothetical protein